jgi:hypothetical protein
MKQIQLNLTRRWHHSNDWHSEIKGYSIGFCSVPIIEIQPLAATKSSLRMTLSSKELPGFVPVNLRQGTYRNCFWRWEIPTLGLVEPSGDGDSTNIFSFMDSIVDGVIRQLMGKGKGYKVPSKYTVWVNLE